MRKTWKDPDTGIIHVIDREEGREHKPKGYESAILHTLSREERLNRFFRRVTMSCGERVQLDSDEFIMPHGEAVLQVPPPILRPWLPGREAPTCVRCITVSAWASNFRGA